MPPNHIVLIVDDDAGIRGALMTLLASHDMHAVSFPTAGEYTAYVRPDVPACLLLDVDLPDINGLDLQEQIVQDGSPDVIFISGMADIPASVRAMKAGAVDFLTKPFKEANLMLAIGHALQRNAESRRRHAALTSLRSCYATLSRRERDVLPLVVSGLLNKQAARVLGISEVTLQIHRGRIMRKMQAASLPDLVRMATALDILPADMTPPARGS